jgi:hypothetical protein
MDEEEEELNDDWIKEFEYIDKDYENLYNSDVFFIHLHFVYINKENSIENITEHKFFMSNPNFISRDELLGLIKRNYIKSEVRYILLSILKYNFKLSSTSVQKFVNSDQYNNNEFLIPIKNIDTIKFEKTIPMFQDLNDLFFVFYEKGNISDELNSKSLTSDFSAYPLKKHSVTKRVFLKSVKKNLRKTQRK